MFNCRIATYTNIGIDSCSAIGIMAYLNAHIFRHRLRYIHGYRYIRIDGKLDIPTKDIVQYIYKAICISDFPNIRIYEYLVI